jgi:hypothetical protein
MTEAERKKAEKEILGLTAKLRWDHVAPHLKVVWEERIAQIKESLKVDP